MFNAHKWILLNVYHIPNTVVSKQWISKDSVHIVIIVFSVDLDHFANNTLLNYMDDSIYAIMSLTEHFNINDKNLCLVQDDDIVTNDPIVDEIRERVT